MKNVKYENGELIIPTKNGNILVKVQDNNEVPGVCIQFERTSLNQGFYGLNKRNIPTADIALIEYDNEEDKLCVCVSEDGLNLYDGAEYSCEYTFKEEDDNDDDNDDNKNENDNIVETLKSKVMKVYFN